MDDRLLTPSKITAFLDCAHYLTLRHLADAGQLEVSGGFGSMAQLLADKGLEHEQACLDDYGRRGLRVLRVPSRQETESFAHWVARVGDPFTGEVDVVYQMPFIHDGIRGIADFVERVVDPLSGDTRWEPVDAKLARAGAKPGHVLQLCFYAEAIESLTGVAPAGLHVWLGSGRVETFRAAAVAPYWRRLRSQLRRVLRVDPDADTSRPDPCLHCAFCEFVNVCEEQWRAEDSLVFVANILKADRAALSAAGCNTMADLAARAEPVEAIRPERQPRLVRQAALQVEARQNSTVAPPVSIIDPPVDGEGFLALPEPDDGDVILDYEGHPFWRPDRGLFFLFGLLTRAADGGWAYEARWAHDPDEEAAEAGRLIEDLADRRRRHPDMHVYHYNHTERSALERMAIEYTVGEQTLADLVDQGLFVDLYAVVTKAMQIGVESYGLKQVERLTDYERSHDIDRGSGAVVEYEAFCHDGDSGRLARIAKYNEDDVRATLALRDWLVAQRPTGLSWRAAAFDQPESKYPEIDEQVLRLHLFDPGSPEHLLGGLLGYWHREARAVFGALDAKSRYDLAAQLDDPDVIGGLVAVGLEDRVGKRGRAITPVMRFRMPTDQALDPKFFEKPSVVVCPGENGGHFATIEMLDLDAGEVTLTWNDGLRELDVLPDAVVLNDWVSPRPKPEALSSLAAGVLDEDGARPPSRAALSILRRELPRFRGWALPEEGFSDDLEEMKEWVLHLDDTCVAIQGPPGTGKTFTGARLIHHLVLHGRRVGVTALGHAAIDKLVDEVTRVFAEHGQLDRLRAVRKVEPSHRRQNDAVTYVNHNGTFADYDVVGGTTWLFARDEWRNEPLDVLFVDEAGQLALADALAAAGAARSVVLLGDPLQLAQVAQGTHPHGAGASVLQHLLGDHATMPSDRGVFLSESWRMHPDVCTFVSELIYENRLTSHESCSVQTSDAGTGLRWLQANHAECSTESEAEALLVRSEVERLVGRRWVDASGRTSTLSAEHFLVVAPYNAQVRMLRSVLADSPVASGVSVGTVDKFQGQEAPVVFFSMTASTADDIPRGLDFLFSKNRFNVAVSRARVLAYVVCTEALLDSRARSTADMELIATVCAFVERCQPIDMEDA